MSFLLDGIESVFGIDRSSGEGYSRSEIYSCWFAAGACMVTSGMFSYAVFTAGVGASVGFYLATMFASLIFGLGVSFFIGLGTEMESYNTSDNFDVSLQPFGASSGFGSCLQMVIGDASQGDHPGDSVELTHKQASSN